MASDATASKTEEINYADLPRVRVLLERGQRGGYGWEIVSRGDDMTAVQDEIQQADRRMRRDYLGEVESDAAAETVEEGAT